MKRLGLEDRIKRLIEPEESLPAVGQGAIGIECCSGRDDLVALLSPLEDADTRWCVDAERALSRALAGSCNVPLGGFAQLGGDRARLRGFVASPDGLRMVADELAAQREAGPEALGTALARRLIDRGAMSILDWLEVGSP